MSTVEISKDEWMKEIERLTSESIHCDGFTSQELIDALNVSRGRIQKFLRLGVKEGKIKVGMRKIDRDWDGRSRNYIVYRFVT